MSHMHLSEKGTGKDNSVRDLPQKDSILASSYLNLLHEAKFCTLIVDLLP